MLRKTEEKFLKKIKYLESAIGAKAMIAREGKDKVVNATIGALLDDDGKLMVLSSVSDVFKTLDMADCAEYAPIAGTPGFREAVKKDLLRSFQPTSYVEAVASPGGTRRIEKRRFQLFFPGRQHFSRRLVLGTV